MRRKSVTMFGLLAAALFCVYALPATAGTVTYDQPFSGSAPFGWSNFSTNGSPTSTITSDGSGHGVIGNTDSATSGAYSAFEGNRVVFFSATESLDVLIDPSVTTQGGYSYQWDLSAGLNQSDKSTFIQDFIFHADGSAGSVYIGTSNNSSDGPVASTSLGNLQIGTAGWYTFAWKFQNDGSGGLSTVMSVSNQGSPTTLGTWSFDNTSYDFTQGAENRYMWFTYLTPTSLSIDNEQFSGTVAPLPAAATAGIGLLALLAFASFVRRRHLASAALD